MKVIKDRELIEALLLENEAYRDDDLCLMARVLHIKLSRIRNKEERAEMSAYGFLQLFAKGVVGHPETIRRTRAEIQRDNPDTRGKKWAKRHGEEQDEAREDLRKYKPGEQTDAFE